MKKLYGLIGRKLSHSFSRQYFNEKFQKEKLVDHDYQLFELNTIGEFPDLIKNHPELKGLNVTIPYKKEILPFLHHIDEAALKIGAVNTIKITGDGLQGYNTDAYGFEKSLFQTVNRKQISGAVILGSGGASKAVSYVLTKNNIPFRVVSRNQDSGYINYDSFALSELLISYNLIINTTPLGMYPDIGSYPPLDYKNISKNHILFDLVYNPESTVFLKKGEQQGAVTRNGLAMLHYQADRAWEIWNDTTL